MKFTRAKILMLAICLLTIYFFSNDFGQIDVEKASIVTAVAIDKADIGYEVSLQVAVPEQNATSANKKTVVTGTGQTVAKAIGEVSSKTGWYQKLAFCNVVLIGEELTSKNVMDFLDYFSRSLKIQSSALLAVTKGKASEVLKKATPLDNFSGFALQKIILQSKGMTACVYSTDIKNFSIGYYSRSKSGHMPYITTITNDTSTAVASQDANSKSNTEEDKPVLFSAEQTMLFFDGKNSGMLSPEETRLAFYIKKNRTDTELPINGVVINGETIDFMLSILKSKSNVKVNVKDGKPVLKIEQTYYVKIADETSNKKDLSLKPTIILPKELIDQTENKLKETLFTLVETCKKTKTDILKIDEQIYRHNHKYYDDLKDDIFKDLTAEIKVTVHGQKGVKEKH